MDGKAWVACATLLYSACSLSEPLRTDHFSSLLTTEQSQVKALVDSGEFCHYPKEDQERIYRMIDLEKIPLVDGRKWIKEQCEKHRKAAEAKGIPFTNKPQPSHAERRRLHDEDIARDIVYDGDPMAQFRSLNPAQLPYQASAGEVEHIKAAVKATSSCTFRNNAEALEKHLRPHGLEKNVEALLYTLVTEDFRYYGKCILGYFSVVNMPGSEEALQTAYDYAPYIALGRVDKFKPSSEMYKSIPGTTSYVRQTILEKMAWSESDSMIAHVQNVAKRDTRIGKAAFEALLERDRRLNPAPVELSERQKALKAFRKHYKAYCIQKNYQCTLEDHYQEYRWFLGNNYPELFKKYAVLDEPSPEDYPRKSRD